MFTPAVLRNSQPHEIDSANHVVESVRLTIKALDELATHAHQQVPLGFS